MFNIADMFGEHFAAVTEAERREAQVALADSEDDGVSMSGSSSGAAAQPAPLRRKINKPKQQPARVVDDAAAQRMRDWSAAMRNNAAAAEERDNSAAPVAVNGVLIAGDEKENIKDEWEFDPFDDDDWENVVEMNWDEELQMEFAEDLTAEDYDPEYCYLCACTQSESELEGNPNLKTFIDFLYNNYSKMKRKELGAQGQRSYNRILRPNTKRKKAMRCKVIIDHIEKHAPTLRVQLEHQNRTLNSCLMEQSKQLREREKGTKRKRLSTKHVATYLKLAAFQNEVTAKLQKLRPDGNRPG